MNSIIMTRQNIQNNTLPRMHGETPADLLKFTAWKKIASNFEEAVNLILGKKLVLGEPIVVPFYYEHKGSIDASTGLPVKTIELVFGIGSADINHPYINCSFNNGIANDAIIINDDGSRSTLKEKLDEIITQEDVDNAILKALDDAGFVDQLSEKVFESDSFNERLDERIEEVTDLLKWKSFPTI